MKWIQKSAFKKQEFDFFLSSNKHHSEIDYSMNICLSKKAFKRSEEIATQPMEGNILAFYDKNENLIHTARYIKQLSWYKYCEEEHGDWYKRLRTI